MARDLKMWLYILLFCKLGHVYYIFVSSSKQFVPKKDIFNIIQNYKMCISVIPVINEITKMPSLQCYSKQQ